MRNGLPVILVWGGDYVARGLAGDLIGNSVLVVLKGEAEDWLNIGKGSVEFSKDINEIDYRIDYIFDFEDDQRVWSRAETDEARLVVVKRNKSGDEVFNKLGKRKMDWRMVCGFDVYGEGMEMNENWLGRVFETAVLNKDLVLPKDSGTLRTLEVRDFVEAIKKTCFVPGISGEKLLIFGKKVSVDEICKTLVDRAKMTKKNLLVREEAVVEIDDNLVSEYWNKISWDGGESFRSRMRETLRYFFERMDPLVRSKKKKDKTKEEIGRKRFMAVEIEETEPQEEKQDVRSKIEDLRMATKLQEEKQDVRSKIEDLRMATKLQEEKQELDIRSKNKEVTKPLLDPPLDKGGGQEVGIIHKKKRFNFNWGLNWKLVVAPFIFLLVVYMGLVVSFFGGIWQSALAIEKTKTLIEEKRSDELKKLTDRQLARIENLKGRLRIVSFEGKIFSYKGWGELLRVLETVWKMEEEMSDFLVDWSRFGEALFSDREMDWQRERQDLKNRLLFLEKSLGMIEARVEGDWSFLPGRFRSMVTDQAKEAGVWKRLVSKISDSMDVFYYLIAADGGRRDFLILMQNEMELRPNGGFIGSFGILSFEDGKFLNLEVGDVYDIDGQLKGHVEPPKPIKEILGEASWYLRDANWQADFLQSARDIEWFFKKETGRNIDGIMTINLAAAKAMVGAVGEVWVADFNEKVTADNLYEQAQFHSEKGFFAGSRQKSMFLGKLTSQLVDQIKEARDFKQLAIVRAVLDSLDKNEIQVFAKDGGIRVDLANLGWDGSMYAGGCPVENCLTDYLFLVEANLGVNKSNYFVRRNIERLVEISNRAVSRVVKINYENTARSTAWPGGDYKNYMRVYIPSDANIAEVSIYDTVDLTSKKILTSGELEVTNKDDKRELAFLVTVPVTKKRTVEIRYSSSVDLNLYKEFSYLSYVQKQSGYGETPIVSLVSYPEDWSIVQVEPAATVVGEKLLFDQIMDRDLVSGVVIGK